MGMRELKSSDRVSVEWAVTVRLVTVLVATVIGLTFLFGFGNVWILALRLGVPPWVAPLVAPAVDLSVVALLLATRYLAVHGASARQLRPARRLLVLSSVITLALNVADPLIAGLWGRATFDAVGPLLLIGWAEVGPALLQALGDVRESRSKVLAGSGGSSVPDSEAGGASSVSRSVPRGIGDCEMTQADDLFRRALLEDARHRKEHLRPISAETLRRRLGVGAARSRALVAAIRSETRLPVPQGVGDGTADGSW